MGMKLDGADKLIRDLDTLAAEMSEDTLDKALRAGAEVILAEMQKQATIDPKIRKGNLHKALKLGKITDILRTGSHRIELGSYEERYGQIAPHAHLVEYGHGGPAPAPPHPFIRPSFDKKVDEAYDAMADVLEDALRL